MNLKEEIEQIYRMVVTSFPQIQMVYKPDLEAGWLMMGRTNIVLQKSPSKRKNNMILIRCEKYSDPKVISAITMALSLRFEKVLIGDNFEIDEDGNLIDDQLEEELPSDEDPIH